MRILKYVLIFVPYLNNTLSCCPPGQPYYRKIVDISSGNIYDSDDNSNWYIFKCWRKRVMTNYRVRLSARKQQQHIRTEAKDYKKEVKRHYLLFY